MNKKKLYPNGGMVYKRLLNIGDKEILHKKMPKVLPEGQNTSIVDKYKPEREMVQRLVNDIVDNKIDPVHLYTQAEIERYYPNLNEKLQSVIRHEIIPRYKLAVKKMGSTQAEIEEIEKILTEEASKIKPVVFRDFGEGILGASIDDVPGISTRYNPKTHDIESTMVHEGGHALDHLLKLNYSVADERILKMFWDKTVNVELVADEEMRKRLYKTPMQMLQREIDNLLHTAYPNPKNVIDPNYKSNYVGEKRNVNREVRNLLLSNMGLEESSVETQNKYLSSISDKKLWDFLRGFGKNKSYLNNYIDQIIYDHTNRVRLADEAMESIRQSLQDSPALAPILVGSELLNNEEPEKKAFGGTINDNNMKQKNEKQEH